MCLTPTLAVADLLEAWPEAKATGRPKGFPRCLTTVELGQPKKGPQTASYTSKQPFISSSGCLSVTATMEIPYSSYYSSHGTRYPLPVNSQRLMKND
ncbi:unnamed protein product [Arctogadus glacialis]